MPFERGRSGNPAGGPVGSRHRQQLNSEFVAGIWVKRSARGTLRIHGAERDLEKRPRRTGAPRHIFLPSYHTLSTPTLSKCAVVCRVPWSVLGAATPASTIFSLANPWVGAASRGAQARQRFDAGRPYQCGASQ